VAARTIAAAGAVALAAAAVHVLGRPPEELALLAGIVVVTEFLQVARSRERLDPLDGQPFSFSSGAHIAAVIVAGPAAGAVVAAFGVVVADSLRSATRLQIAVNASVFALAALAGGGAFHLLGGTTGAVSLPADVLAVAGLALAYVSVNVGIVGLLVALTERLPLSSVLARAAREQAGTAVAEAGLGVVLAVIVLREPWAILALAPLVLAVYQAHARLALLRQQTAHALEAFASVVDERDPSTYDHSARVAELVRSFAASLGLPDDAVARLWRAGRLHDLGKVAVDSRALGKPGTLDEREWQAVRRHPRVSARILRGFRFAADEARAVEFHHDRYDGNGYYGARGDEIPLAAHVVIVADAYDAMTSDRPYRSALRADHALAEIERQAGAQFHPVVAKAFAAHRRGRDPLTALTPEERRELAALARRPRRSARSLLGATRAPETLAVAGVLTALAGLGTGTQLATLGGLAVAAVAGAAVATSRVRAARLAAALAEAAAAPLESAAFERVAARVARAAALSWAGVLAWRPLDVDGWIPLEWTGGGDPPREATLASWLLRESEVPGAMRACDGAEVGTDGSYLAVALGSGRPPRGYAVFRFAAPPPAHVGAALEAVADRLAFGADHELPAAFAPRAAAG